jgi:hypothetical protein
MFCLLCLLRMRLDKNPNGYAVRVLPWGVGGGEAPQKLKPPGLTVRDATHNDLA